MNKVIKKQYSFLGRCVFLLTILFTLASLILLLVFAFGYFKINDATPIGDLGLWHIAYGGGDPKLGGPSPSSNAIITLSWWGIIVLIAALVAMFLGFLQLLFVNKGRLGQKTLVLSWTLIVVLLILIILIYCVQYNWLIENSSTR